MIRIGLSSLAVAAILAIGGVTPAVSGSFQNDSQPTSCDCSNCSAEHCQGTNTRSGTFTLVFNGSTTTVGTGFATQPVAVDPNNPNVVYVGGSRRY